MEPLCSSAPVASNILSPTQTQITDCCNDDSCIALFTPACMTESSTPACYTNENITPTLSWFTTNSDSAYCVCDDGSVKCNVGTYSSPAECATACGEMTSLSPVEPNKACQFSKTTNQYVVNSDGDGIEKLNTVPYTSGTDADYLLAAQNACMTASDCIAITQSPNSEGLWTIVPGGQGWLLNQGSQANWTTYTPPTDSNCTAESLYTANTSVYPYAACDLSKQNHVAGCGELSGSASSYLKNCTGCSVKDGQLSCKTCSTCMGCNGEDNPTWSPAAFDTTTCAAGSDIVADESTKGFKCGNTCGSSWSQDGTSSDTLIAVVSECTTAGYALDTTTNMCKKVCPANYFSSGGTDCVACTCDTSTNKCGGTADNNIDSVCNMCPSGKINKVTFQARYGDKRTGNVITGEYAGLINDSTWNAIDTAESLVSRVETQTDEHQFKKVLYGAAIDAVTTAPPVKYWNSFTNSHGKVVQDPWKNIKYNIAVANHWKETAQDGMCYPEAPVEALMSTLIAQSNALSKKIEYCNISNNIYDCWWAENHNHLLTEALETVAIGLFTAGAGAVIGGIMDGVNAGFDLADSVADAADSASDAADSASDAAEAGPDAGDAGADETGEDGADGDGDDGNDEDGNDENSDENKCKTLDESSQRHYQDLNENINNKFRYNPIGKALFFRQYAKLIGDWKLNFSTDYQNEALSIMKTGKC